MPAAASPVYIDPGDSNTLLKGILYLTGTESKGANQSFVDVYNFHLPEQSTPANGNEGVSFSANVIDSFPKVSKFGIKNLTLTIFDVTNATTLLSHVLTDATGMGPGWFLTDFSAPSDIDLTVTVSGTALANGGSYNIAIAAVPLPATLPLLLGGLGFLAVARRRRAAA